MTNKNYFETELGVQFTMSELFEITSALATEAFKCREEGFKNLSNKAWELRSKVIKQMDKYNNL